ncbi:MULTISPECIES: 2-oxo acid dehydrogenase subunit E2 [unclassified Streptomyces]|uniref:2-oxo acid dehydrogenase subunit E2 n=1 Tax=unclassified Streptomyces TaxID=2593676 RepID=UPI003822A02F
MAEIRVPKLNNNDDSYVLLEWLVGDEEPIGADDDVATIETSKAAEDLVSAAGGVLHHMVPAGAVCRPGDLIGRVVPPGTPRAERAAPTEATEAAGPDDGPVITAPARQLLAELGIDPELTRTLGVKVVRRSDVERLTARSAADGNTLTLPTGQQAVARTVTRSHQTIPSAYTVIRVEVGGVVDRARVLTGEWRKLVGVPEFLIMAVAGLRERFPLCFASPVDERTVSVADGAHVGVTIDIGKGLYVPVVRDAHTMGLKEIATSVGDFRNKALHGSFREQDLTGGTIAVTLHNDEDVTVAVPIVFPGQVCALALGGIRPELVPGADGGAGTDDVRIALVAHVGLAYDHRVLNGRDAVLFLRAVKESLEKMGSER